MDAEILKLSELQDLIGEAIQMSLEPVYWVEAEVMQLQDRGHCYMDLAEKGDNGEFAAKARATCWQRNWQRLQARFIDETGRRIEAGMKIRIAVEVTFHAVYGLSLNILDIDPSCTLGDLARKRQETMIRLEKEGLIDLQRGLVLPTLVQRLAVISSGTAAGYEDFVMQLKHSDYRFEPTLFPATMQGDTAAASIIEALEAIREQAEQFDAIVIIRGGGASTDLSCFDSYELCRACAMSPLPVLSGIGHTRDISLLDMIAHLPLKTPTAVADWLIDRLSNQQQKIIELRHRLKMSASLIIERRRNVLRLLEQRLNAANPERIYERGYSLLTCEGRIIRSVEDVKKGAKLTTHLRDGEIQSTAD